MPPARKSAQTSNYVPTTGGPEPLSKVLTEVKKKFDEGALGGPGGLLSQTRGAGPIKLLHQHVADLLLQAGIPASSLGFEKEIPTRFGDKRQDVVAIPRGINKPAGSTTLSVSVAGQFYGIQKNKDNSFSKARAELLNLHEKNEGIVLAHVQVVAVVGWDSKKLKAQRARREAYAPEYSSLSPMTLAETIDRFSKINRRQADGSPGDAERVALVLADFSQKTPLVFTEIAALEDAGMLPKDSGLSLDHLTLDDFAADLLTAHRSRHTGANRL